MTCGFVLVSHSRGLAEAVAELAAQMTPGDPVAMAIAAGTAEGGIGTDAVAVSEAIEEVASTAQQVLIFTDLGSAILSVQTALDFIDPDIADRCVLSRAPFVEGVVGAAAKASLGKDVAEVDREACRGLAPKESLIQPPASKQQPRPVAPTPVGTEVTDPFDPQLPRMEFLLDVTPGDYRRAATVREECDRLAIAQARAAAQVRMIATDATVEGVDDVLATIASLVEDRRVTALLQADIDSCGNAFEAVERRLSSIADKVSSARTEIMREEAVDVRLVARLILGALTGAPLAGVADARDIHTPCVLVLPELDAVSAALLKPSAVTGVEVHSPSTVGHGMTIAQLLGVPVTHLES